MKNKTWVEKYRLCYPTLTENMTDQDVLDMMPKDKTMYQDIMRSMNRILQNKKKVRVCK